MRVRAMECFGAGWIACILPTDVLAGAAGSEANSWVWSLAPVMLIFCLTVILRFAYISLGWLRNFASRRLTRRRHLDEDVSLMRSVLHELMMERREAKRGEAKLPSPPPEFASPVASPTPAPVSEKGRPGRAKPVKPEPENLAAFFDAFVVPSKGGAIKAGDLLAMYIQRCSGTPVSAPVFYRAARARFGEPKRRGAGSFYRGFAVRDGVLKVVTG